MTRYSTTSTYQKDTVRWLASYKNVTKFIDAAGKYEKYISYTMQVAREKVD